MNNFLKKLIFTVVFGIAAGSIIEFNYGCASADQPVEPGKDGSVGTYTDSSEGFGNLSDIDETNCDFGAVPCPTDGGVTNPDAGFDAGIDSGQTLADAGYDGGFTTTPDSGHDGGHVFDAGQGDAGLDAGRVTDAGCLEDCDEDTDEDVDEGIDEDVDEDHKHCDRHRHQRGRGHHDSNGRGHSCDFPGEAQDEWPNGKW